MNRDQKAAVVDEIAGELEQADAIFAVDYRGISVSDAADLRAKLREANAVFRVVKNSLTERAADKAGASALKEHLDGPTALTLVSGDPAMAAKTLSDKARALRILDFKGGLMNGNALTAEEIQSIARLPSRELLHGQLVGTIAGPLSGLVRTLNALVAGLAVQLQQIADQRAEESPSPEATAAEETSPAPEATGGGAETENEVQAARVTSDADEAPPEEGAPDAEADPAAEAEAHQTTESEPDESSSDGESDAKEE
jgi:large subunit ribosomal protein L10